jgi:acyl-CoA synthetase (AMP-forming)/AMP-acid ligase II
MYGLTECKSVSGLDPKDLTFKPDSVGKPLPNMEVFVVDKEGNKFFYNATGELVVRGSNVMKGYLNNKLETDKKLKPGLIPYEMYLYTGDLFRIDNEGYLYFQGRIDNMINTSGVQISPNEIEDVIYELNGVIEAAVIPIPHHIWGEAIKAVISIKDNSDLNTDKIKDYCYQRLEKICVPHVFKIIESLPKTPNGKIDKKALIEL